jgi:hypothetical protein
MCFRLSWTFQFGLKNIHKRTKVFTLDCSTSTNSLFSDKGGRVTKQVMPGEFVVMMEVEASADALEFKLGWNVVYQTDE